MELKEFGAAIKAKREKAGLTKEDVAVSAGCTAANIRLIEEKGQVPSLQLAHMILVVLGSRLTLGKPRAKALIRRGE